SRQRAGDGQLDVDRSGQKAPRRDLPVRQRLARHGPLRRLLAAVARHPQPRPPRVANEGEGLATQARSASPHKPEAPARGPAALDSSITERPARAAPFRSPQTRPPNPRLISA